MNAIQSDVVYLQTNSTNIQCKQATAPFFGKRMQTEYFIPACLKRELTV